MAINIPIISDFTDKGIKDARTSFAKFKADVGDAEGAMGKFKAGSTAAMDFVKQNSAAFATAAAGAIATFAISGVNAFKDLALEASKFAASTGLAVDDASRWMEVAGDLGVNADTIQTAIGKMNKELAGNPNLLKKLGDDVIYAKDGTLDANATFLNLIERLKNIKDPAEKAKEGARLFGKGWQEMSVLIEEGAGKLKESLASVSEAKVIDQEEVEKAKRLRDALDNLKGIGEDLALTLGQNLIPILEKMIWLMEKFATISRGAGGVVELTTEQMAELGVETAVAQLATEENAKAMEGYYRSRIEYYNQTHPLAKKETEAIKEQKDAVWSLNEAWQIMLGTLDLENKFRDTEDAIRKANEAAIEAFGDASQFGAYKDAQDDVIRKFTEIMAAMKLTSDEQNRIKFLVDTAPLEYALEALRQIDLVNAGIVSNTLTRYGSTATGKRAAGGPVMGGVSYLVGERGPEIFTPGTSGTISANNTFGGNTITINVTGADPNAVVNALQQYVRQSGPVPVNTRAM